jgi:fructose-1,6-bisphosphatase/inositol monophosphatase family enzyme
LPATEVADPAVAAARLAEHAREAGKLALSMFQTPIKSWTKAGSSPVCDADVAVDRLLRERLSAEGSGVAWLSEESVDDPARLTARYVWIVDPIDGTRAYLAGLPDWTISTALVDSGRPIAACLYAPVTDELFVAAAGKGVTHNGVAIATSGGASLAQNASPDRRHCSSGSPRLPRRSSSCRGCLRSLCGLRAWRRELSTPRSPAATVMTGTLQPPIFWCTKRAAR